MPGLFLSTSTLEPAPTGTGASWAAISHSWQAWDGTLWDLSSGQDGVYLRAGVIGMDSPPMIRYFQKSPAVAGSIYRGSIPDERPVTWPLKIFNDAGSQSLIDLTRAFRRTLHPEKTGRWIVLQPGGEYRTLDVRFVDDGGEPWASSEKVDPELSGFVEPTFQLIAEQPYWRGKPIEITWEPDGSTPPGTPYVLFIASSNAIYGARISNPGSVDAWPVWTAHGPFTSASVGVGADLITLPFTRAAGHYVTIDTDPTQQTAIDDLGVDVTSLLGTVDFAPVPPGLPADLNVTMAGTGSVDVSITPNYYTATAN